MLHWLPVTTMEIWCPRSIWRMYRWLLYARSCKSFMKIGIDFVSCVKDVFCFFSSFKLQTYFEKVRSDQTISMSCHCGKMLMRFYSSSKLEINCKAMFLLLYYNHCRCHCKLLFPSLLSLYSTYNDDQLDLTNNIKDWEMFLITLRSKSSLW